MNKALFFISLILTATTLSAGEVLDSLLHVLDLELIHNKKYIQLREDRIAALKMQSPLSSEDTYSINRKLFYEYKPYICDSAIYYMNYNLALATEMQDMKKLKETVFDLSYLLSSSALYKEAEDILALIPRSELLPEDLTAYYNCYDHLYGELAFYTNDKRNAELYEAISGNYKDSLLQVIDKNSDIYLKLQETFFRDEGQYDKSLEINDIRLSRLEPDQPGYATVTFYRSLSYWLKGDIENRKIWLALSALADVQQAIKDNASLGLLADVLYNEGDIDRAYNYIMHSFDDANYFNARLRGFQISSIQSIINKTYQRKIQEQNEKLRTSLTIISLLSLFIIAALIFIYGQMKKLSVARNSLQKANELLNNLNTELSSMNEKLLSINGELSEANHIKEEYIGHFLTPCSTYIEKMENYRKMVYKRIKTGKIQDLLKTVDSGDLTENELKEFYTNFDTTFLHLYPGFVQQFNELLAPDEQIILKKGELLNTELRIYALIRLGIDDSARIAEFLRYSVNTIYNYRAKVKNKSIVPRDDFDSYVSKIGGNMVYN
ncbi:MAG: DUF6377 domain-containing protein [Tannerellaceae bacterium]|nr:DUF6377 domain-containing protein [Tannerellaceae bacterium]